MVGTQSYTLRLSSQNRLSLSREGSFHGFALGLWNIKKGGRYFRVRTPVTDTEHRDTAVSMVCRQSSDACMIHWLAG